MSRLRRTPLRSDFPWVADEVFRLSQSGLSVEDIGRRYGVERIMATALVKAGRQRDELDRKGIPINPARKPQF
jgi:hypothetical protein